MSVTISTIEACKDIPDCMTAQEIRLAKLDDEQLGRLSEYYCMVGHQQM